MISKKMEASLNEQLNKELYSAYLYLSMAGYSYFCGLNGFANWFNVQLQEELMHAKKFYDYIHQQASKIVLKSIDEPPKDFLGSSDLFEKTLEHEKKVTKRINDLVDLARKDGDHATEAFLQWFITEQVEEESSAAEILQKLNLIGKDGAGLLTIDSQLAARVFVPPQASKPVA